MDGNQNMTPNSIYGDGGRYSRSKCLKEDDFIIVLCTDTEYGYVLTCANIN